MKIGIIGGGYHGLVLGYFLSRENSVVVFEKEPEVGGLLRMVKVEGHDLEKYYHHIFFNDIHLKELFRDLDLEIEWLDSLTSVYINGRFLPFFKPTDLINFPFLGLLSKIRLGLGTFFLQNYKKGEKLNKINASNWIRKIMGEEVWQVLWKPLFQGKFDSFYEDISLSWFWARIFAKRGKSFGKGEILGYPKSGFQILADKLKESIEANGGQVKINEEVKGIEVIRNKATGVKTAKNTYNFDLVISTLPPAVFKKLLPSGCRDFQHELGKVEYLGAISTILVLKEKLTPAYWNNILDPQIPFKGIIEHTNWIDKSRYGGLHLAYLSHYTPVSSKFFLASNEKLMEMYRPHLLKIDKNFNNKLAGYYIGKDFYCQPIVKVNYPKTIIDYKTPIENLYQFSMAQIFPEDRGLDAATEKAKEISMEINYLKK